jgi:polysaccharide pyruvyl transferase WcaK-like protein
MNVRIVVIGDIGVLDDMVHIGDEAMFDKLVHQMRARGIDDITAVSSNPAETSARYGVDAVANIGFRTQRSREELDARMDLVVRTAAGDTGLLADDDTAHAVIEVIRASDGVAVSGGGNMASTWPSHIYERGTIGEIARLLGKPLVVSGQTIGPHLTAADGEIVARLLSGADLVGLRESPSYDLSLALGVPAPQLTKTVDDASFLADQPGDAEATPPRPYCLVSLSTHVGEEDRAEFQQATALLLDSIAAQTGLDVVFFAHFASLNAEESRGDTVMHNAVIERMSAPTTGSTSGDHPRVTTVHSGDSVFAARLARSAALVVSSRYHPAVFAVSGGVPTIGIPVDDYTTTKLTGALGNFGQSTLLPAADLVAGRGTAVASALWADRETVRTRGSELAVDARAASRDWWDRIAEVLTSGSED